MRTVIAVASVVVLLGMIVAGWSRARPDRRELPRIHLWRRRSTSDGRQTSLNVSLQRIQATGHY